MPKYLLTSALPYANGSIHLGHLVEHTQTDIYARFLRSLGEDVLYVCADDTHGTGTELNARKEGIAPEQLVERCYKEHVKDFSEFHMSFDFYYTTNSPENRELAEFIYRNLGDGGHVVRKKSMQMYSENLGRFLPDRWVKGTCPKCKAPDQYGDVCEVCRTTYEPTDLIDPMDAIEGKTPVVKETEQLYVRLSHFTDFLKQWLKHGTNQSAIQNYVSTWLEEGLDDWCISRDAPYFGFEIPGEPGKYFYVWLDAPVGYIASTKRYCDLNDLDWLSYWGDDADCRLIHVIGKDIVYFHTLFWPAMLQAAGFKTPDHVHVHGFLTVNGAKMSKSRGTFIKASTYLAHLDPDYLRFYFAAKQSASVDDIDLNFEDFVARVNADLVNNVVNLCNRVGKFIASRFDGQVGQFDPATTPLSKDISTGLEEAREAFLRWDYSQALRHIAEVGDRVNTFIQSSEPWKVIKEEPERASEICAIGLHGAIALMAALAPVTPGLADRFAQSIGLEHLTWEHTSPSFLPERIDPPKTLLDRIDEKALEAMVQQSKQETQPARTDVVEVETFKPEITFDDFSKLDLRVGVVEEATLVDGADKLLKLSVHCGRPVQVFAGIRESYPDPSVLVGKRVVIVANLKPRKMRFGTSEGMLLAASADDGEGLMVVHPDEAALGGWSIR